MTKEEKAIREFCGKNADWWPSTTQVQEMLALARPEQGPVSLMIYRGELCYKSQADDQSFGMWCPVTKDLPFPEGTKFYTTPPQRQTLTDEMVVTAARMLNERQADACGVDRDDQWAIYSDDFKADARAMLDAAHGIKE